MTQGIVIDPVTRIEGHAKISIYLNDTELAIALSILTVLLLTISGLLLPSLAVPILGIGLTHSQRSSR